MNAIQMRQSKSWHSSLPKFLNLGRPVSLSFRLYGNIFAGENMLEAMSTLVPGLGWLLPIPFYFMELLVGLVQALVFVLLTAVFTLLSCQHEEVSPSGATATET
jgi:F0F1-type ATP synthase membrane subunit a